MQFRKTVTLRDGTPCLLRTLCADDAKEMLSVFVAVHGETEYMLTYADEVTFTEKEEADYLQKLAAAENAVEIGAFVDGTLVGSAGIEPIGEKIKNSHRADFGIGILLGHSGKGIGRALTEACIACAREAGYAQLELEAVAENEAALALYRKAGFTEYGRNPKGFRTRDGRDQTLVLMRLDLE